jgi:hypothetical protein
MHHFIENPLPVIFIGLGIVPLIFSLFFWFIPLARFALLKKDNEKIKLENLRKSAFMTIWENPDAVKTSDIKSDLKECRPQNMAAAQEQIIKDMGVYSIPDVTVNESGETVYVFKELDREKTALAKYRAGINSQDSELGKIVFNTDE